MAQTDAHRVAAWLKLERRRVPTGGSSGSLPMHQAFAFERPRSRRQQAYQPQLFAEVLVGVLAVPRYRLLLRLVEYQRLSRGP